ncbi:hypothetical protein S13b_00007 [Klebsiella phage VLCpiS13b]|uniref:hypothetical protein n=1 Tax=Klebsiella phage VLCpiS13b TaxID=2874886 RepID=UPI00233E9EBF|nr:hypothetical protein PRB92_gp07 [Klebsiella phage VLCpiS13b]UVX30584.1 hypothetical protein S13b_00007 [Klebsiella phage VLCpiS13b]
MTRKEIHETATGCRKWIEEIWFRPGFTGKRYQLYAKCRGLVLGDRIEMAIFHHDNKPLQERAFGD